MIHAYTYTYISNITISNIKTRNPQSVRHPVLRKLIRSCFLSNPFHHGVYP